MKYRPKHVAEYVALRAIAALLNALPYRAALGAAWLLAGVALLGARSRFAEARRRIRQVFGTRFSEREIARIAWTSWRSLAFNGVEMLRAGRITRAWIAARSNSDVAMQRIASLCGSGRGGIVAGPHMGNWELAGVTMRLHDLPIFTIAARQKNPLTDRYLNALRTTFGIPAVMRGSGTMKDVLRKLKAGMLLAILPDLRAAEHGILIPFLGGQASIAPGMALFARHAEIPIFLTLVRRIGWTSHSLEVLDPVYPDKSLDKDEDVRRMTGLIMRNIEKAILDDPAQWFWFNKRWILDPV